MRAIASNVDLFMVHLLKTLMPAKKSFFHGEWRRAKSAGGLLMAIVLLSCHHAGKAPAAEAPVHTAPPATNALDQRAVDQKAVDAKLDPALRALADAATKSNDAVLAAAKERSVPVEN